MNTSDTDGEMISGVPPNQMMRDILRMAERAADTDLPILIVGEPGTGKEWLARHIHSHSKVADKKFIEFYCQVLHHQRLEVELFGMESANGERGLARPGVMERTGSGTLFFRRISEIPLDLQSRIAQTLQTRTYSRVNSPAGRLFRARAVASLTQSPLALVREGNLSRDIYRSFTAMIMTVPPLRDRREDIPLLVETFIRECNTLHGTDVPGVSPEALELFTTYGWPGNVRELRNAVRYATLLSVNGNIRIDHLPPALRDRARTMTGAAAQALITVAAAEKNLIEQTLDRVVSKKESARILGISIKTLYNKLVKYSLREKFIGAERSHLQR